MSSEPQIERRRNVMIWESEINGHKCSAVVRHQAGVPSEIGLKMEGISAELAALLEVISKAMSFGLAYGSEGVNHGLITNCRVLIQQRSGPMAVGEVMYAMVFVEQVLVWMQDNFVPEFEDLGTPPDLEQGASYLH
jgi:hypothetical protein